MRRALFIAAVMCLLVAPAWGQQKVLTEKSEIKFAGKQMNVPQEGTFKKFSAEVNLDPKKPEANRAQIVIDVDSIDTGSAESDTEVKRKPWFDSASHPQAKFVSTKVKALGGGRFEMAGKLTIKGMTRDVVAPFTMKEAGALTTAQGAFEIKRLDFKVGEGVWADTETVANEVQIKFRIAASGAPTAK
jgi:polyisoprenoid-binding protein YceI